jgi:hypothetical protein
VATIDYERAWGLLKTEIVSKPSHGKKDLLASIGEIEVKCMAPEDTESFDTSHPEGRRRPLRGAQNGVAHHGMS